MLRRVLAVGRLVWLLALAVACASPTLPLPPPEAPTQQSADADHVRLVGACGGAEANAIIVVLNTNPNVPRDQAGVVSLADGCGAWDATVFAHPMDVLDITQEFGLSRSTPAVVQVR